MTGVLSFVHAGIRFANKRCHPKAAESGEAHRTVLLEEEEEEEEVVVVVVVLTWCR